MSRPKVNGILRSIALLCTVYLMVVLGVLIIGDTIGVQEVDPWVRTFGATSAGFAGMFNLIVLLVYDNV